VVDTLEKSSGVVPSMRGPPASLRSDRNWLMTICWNFILGLGPFFFSHSLRSNEPFKHALWLVPSSTTGATLPGWLPPLCARTATQGSRQVGSRFYRAMCSVQTPKRVDDLRNQPCSDRSQRNVERYHHPVSIHPSVTVQEVIHRPEGARTPPVREPIRAGDPGNG